MLHTILIFGVIIQDWIIYIIFYYTRDTSVSWDDIGIIIQCDIFLSIKNIFFTAVGLENAKSSLQEIVVLPALNPAVSVMLNKIY